MALEAAAGPKAVLEQPGEQRLFPREGRQAITDVARGLHPQLPAQHPATPAVIGHRDDRGDVAAVALQATEQGREPGAAADGHDVGTPIQPALGGQGIHQQGALIGGQGLLDRAKTATLPPQNQGRPRHQHQGARDPSRQNLSDLLEQPFDGAEHPIDGLEVSPDRRSQEG